MLQEKYNLNYGQWILMTTRMCMVRPIVSAILLVLKRALSHLSSSVAVYSILLCCFNESTSFFNELAFSKWKFRLFYDFVKQITYSEKKSRESCANQLQTCNC